MWILDRVTFDPAVFTFRVGTLVVSLWRVLGKGRANGHV